MTSQTSLRRLLVASCAGATTAVVLPRAVPMLADTGLLRPPTHDDGPENTSSAQAADPPTRGSGRKAAVVAVGLAYPTYRAWRFTRRLRARISTEEN